jgi:hypothetical protein
MISFYLSDDNRFSVSLAVGSLAIRNEVSVSEALCDRIEASVSVYLAEGSGELGAGDAAPALRSLALRLTQDDPSVGEIRDLIRALPAAAVEQIESRALRLADQVPACAIVGSDLLGWAKVAPAADLVSILRLCMVEGGAMVRGQDRPTGRQSAPHYEPVVFGRGRGMKWLPKLEGGRPADNAEVRLITHLAVDWHLATGFEPEAGRDGHSGFSGLVHDVFGWIGRSKKAKFSLRAYWAMVADKAGTHPAADQTTGN